MVNCQLSIVNEERAAADVLARHSPALAVDSPLALWTRLARIPGVYVPALYDVSYAADGTIAAVTPNHADRAA